MSDTSSTVGEVGTSQGDTRRDGGQTGTITQELVDEIADKVYAMLVSELRVEKERRPLPARAVSWLTFLS